MSLLIAVVIAVGIGAAARATRGYGLISDHAYNNVYSDASGARGERGR